mgnify:CR=1 FL=1
MALHGGFGENGKIQATFDTLGIRYTGPNSLGCALSMNKGVTKEIFPDAGSSYSGRASCTHSQKDLPLSDLASLFPL